MSCGSHIHLGLGLAPGGSSHRARRHPGAVRQHGSAIGRPPNLNRERPGHDREPERIPQFTIQFLNPSGSYTLDPAGQDIASGSGPGTEISAKSDGADERYHLVAWIKGQVTDPTVEFKFQQGGPEITLGTGQLVAGTTDTYQFFWNVGATTGISDAAANLRVILFSGQNEVSRDEVAVTINDAGTPPTPPTPQSSEPRGETVEIVYPVQTTTGATPPLFGLYKPPTGNPAGVVDVTSSANTTAVRVFYTLSPAGPNPPGKLAREPAERRKRQARTGFVAHLPTAIPPLRSRPSRRRPSTHLGEVLPPPVRQRPIPTRATPTGSLPTPRSLGRFSSCPVRRPSRVCKADSRARHRS